MRKNTAIVIAGMMALCMAAAGCASQTGQTGSDAGSASETAVTAAAAAEAATAATGATAEASEAAAELETPVWQDMDDAYLSGVNSEEYVELPDDYRHLEVEVASPVDPTDEDVERRIVMFMQSQGTPEEVDRKVRNWDVVSIDYVGKVDGKEFEGGTGSYDLMIGSGSFIEGFEEGLIGAKKGETRDIEVTFPEAYQAPDLAGKDAVFTVTVNKISAYKLTDEFVKGLNYTDGFGRAVTNVDEFREYVRSNMIQRNLETYNELVRRSIDSLLLQKCTFKQDPPENMVESFYFNYRNYFTNVASSYYMDLPTFMARYYGATEDNYDLMIHDYAVQGAKVGLIYQRLADKKDLNPTEKEVESYISKKIEEEGIGMNAEELPRYRREYLRDELMSANVAEWLLKHCDVKEPEEKEDDADAAGTSETAEKSEESSDGASTSEKSEESSDGASTSEKSEESSDGASTSEKAEKDK